MPPKCDCISGGLLMFNSQKEEDFEEDWTEEEDEDWPEEEEDWPEDEDEDFEEEEEW